MKAIADVLLKMTEEQLDRSMHPYIEKWSAPPTALQVLEVLDRCVHGALASSFVIGSLRAMLGIALKGEGKTLEQLEPEVTWRPQRLVKPPEFAVDSPEAAKARIRAGIGHLKRASRLALQEAGRGSVAMLAVLAVQPDGAGHLSARMDLDSLLVDLELLVGPVEEISEADAKADELLARLGL